MDIKKPNSKVVRFIIAGITSVGTSYGLLIFLTEVANLWYLFSSAVAFIANGVLNFIFHKYWTFDNKNKEKMFHQMRNYLLFFAVIFICNTYFMFLLVEKIHLIYWVSQIVVTCVLSVVSFFVTKLIFKN